MLEVSHDEPAARHLFPALIGRDEKVICGLARFPSGDSIASASGLSGCPTTSPWKARTVEFFPPPGTINLSNPLAH